MSFSPQWEKTYAEGRHLSIWPWSDLVSYVCRYARPDMGFDRVLELGCGAGANIPFFRQLKVDYSAIEGSPTIVALLHETYPELKEKIVVGDFTQIIPFAGTFDLVVDRISLAHNTTEAMRRTLAMIFDRLRPGGKFIGIDWFSTAHQDAHCGVAVDDYTQKEMPIGSHLAGTGMVHFCDQDHLTDLLMSAGFVLERLEHKQNDIVIPTNGKLAWWNFVAAKP